MTYSDIYRNWKAEYGTLPVEREGELWVNPYDRAQYWAIVANGAIDFTGDPGLTQQAPAEEQDINVIMKRFGVKDGSVLPYWSAPLQMYGDYSEMPEGPVEAQEFLRRGEVAFMTLPADVRKNFESGAHMYHWLNDEKNWTEAEKMGLLSISTGSDEAIPVPTPPTPQGES